MLKNIRLTTVLLFALLIVIIGSGFYVFIYHPMHRINYDSINRDVPQEGAITTHGRVACLQHRSTGANQGSTMECLVGLHATDGRYYSLNGDSSVDTTTGSYVTVSGVFTPVTTTKSLDLTYDIVGTIQVNNAHLCILGCIGQRINTVLDTFL